MKDFKTIGLSVEDVQCAIEQLLKQGLVEEKDYEIHIAYGDDIPNAITPKNEVAQSILQQYEESEY